MESNIQKAVDEVERLRRMYKETEAKLLRHTTYDEMDRLLDQFEEQHMDLHRARVRLDKLYQERIGVSQDESKFSL